MPLKIHYPFKYINTSQKWGNPNPAYNQFGFTLHNGIDLTCGYANQTAVYAPKTWPVYCPVENFVVKRVDFNPTGGGNELWLLSKQRLQIGDKFCFAYMPLCHADKVLIPAGYEPAVGELLMVADSTGFSTGAHTHMGLYRVEYDGANMTYLDTNNANGSYDPELFFTKEFAVDKASYTTLFTSALRYYQYLLGLK